MKANTIQNSLLPFLACFVFALTLYPNSTIDIDNYSTEGLNLQFILPDLHKTVPTSDSSDLRSEIKYPSPVLGKGFEGFKEALAFKESRGNYFTINTYGYLGKYQFGAETLKLIGIHNLNSFLNNPKIQEQAFMANAKRNKWILRNYIKVYEGQNIAGVRVTESGMLAAAHLAGPGSVIKFLTSSGHRDVKDSYGSYLSSYMRMFEGYDTSVIDPVKNARVRP